MKRLLGIVLSVIGKRGIMKYVVLGIFSGLSSFLFINNVTRIIGMLISGNLTVVRKEYIIIFIAIILTFIWSRRQLALLSINITQRIGWKLRKEILSLALNANYQQLSGRKARIQSAILSDVGALTNASMGSIDFFIQIIMAISCLAYMASISVILFLVTIVVAGFGVTVYYFTSRKNMKGFEKARKIEDKFQVNLNAILNGFKEIFMEPKKGRYLYDHKICVNANESYSHNTRTLTGLINNQITGQILFYILITSILLVFSVVLGIKASGIVAFVFTLLYLLGSIEAIMLLLPTLMRAGVASNHLMDLKNDLEQADFREPVVPKYIFNNAFERITIRNLEFSYTNDDTSFSIGPVNFSIHTGETIFIYGGNGSGKTTLIHSVLGLCYPSAGEISVNGTLINEDNYADYRSLFAVVFSDFYLFNEIIGVDHFDRAQWDYYIHLFELDGKVEMDGKHFSTTDLSTGQRKRLALIAILLENKPILVIDEWAADQDPYFRRKFYTEIIPHLKKQGIAVIAITHDDKYYHYADKLFKMDEGKLSEEDTTLHKPVFIPDDAKILIK